MPLSETVDKKAQSTLKLIFSFCTSCNANTLSRRWVSVTNRKHLAWEPWCHFKVLSKKLRTFKVLNPTFL